MTDISVDFINCQYADLGVYGGAVHWGSALQARRLWLPRIFPKG